MIYSKLKRYYCKYLIEELQIIFKIMLKINFLKLARFFKKI